MKTKRVLVATANQHKLAEIAAILGDGFETVSLSDVKIDFDVAETGQTFAENAQLKARTYGRVAQMLTLAEDSGLMVESLAGQPGVQSKRFVDGTDEDRNRQVLSLLQDITDRRAKYVTVVAVYDPDEPETPCFEGEVRGRITDEERGEGGFGYDPIFIPEGSAQTFAELGTDQKNKFSHRQRALAKVVKYLREKYELSAVN